jgi:hypothetical protein
MGAPKDSGPLVIDGALSSRTQVVSDLRYLLRTAPRRRLRKPPCDVNLSCRDSPPLQVCSKIPRCVLQTQGNTALHGVITMAIRGAIVHIYDAVADDHEFKHDVSLPRTSGYLELELVGYLLPQLSWFNYRSQALLTTLA